MPGFRGLMREAAQHHGGNEAWLDGTPFILRYLVVFGVKCISMTGKFMLVAGCRAIQPMLKGALLRF